jgi:uncharacterized protein YjeT (DUF2065 family)
MLKIILLGMGFIFVFEGLVYFFLAKKTKSILKTIDALEPEKIRSFSSIIMILGLCLIYFTLKYYD